MQYILSKYFYAEPDASPEKDTSTAAGRQHRQQVVVVDGAVY